jgi:hypothetical protein
LAKILSAFNAAIADAFFAVFVPSSASNIFSSQMDHRIEPFERRTLIGRDLFKGNERLPFDFA